MKISIEIREPDAEGKRALRLTYYAGSYLDPACLGGAGQERWL